MLALFVSCPAWRLTSPRVALSPAIVRARCYHPVLTEKVSWWDKLVYGQQGPPGPPPPPAGLRAVFDQWDTNDNGILEVSELKRALLAVGIEPEAVLEALIVLGAEDEDGVTYEDLEARLPPGPRASIEARLNKDGVMESLYVPPEKVWQPSLPIPRPSQCVVDSHPGTYPASLPRSGRTRRAWRRSGAISGSSSMRPGAEVR